MTKQNKLNTFPKTGPWKVTTESDCEDRGPRTVLGVFEGTVPQVLRELFKQGKRPCYEYHFKLMAPMAYNQAVTPMKPKEVHISFDIESGTWDMSPKERAKVIQEFVGDEAVVSEGQYYASARMTLPEVENTSK